MHLKSDEQGLTSEGVSVVLHSRRALPPTVSRMFTRDATRQTLPPAHRVVSAPQFSTGTRYAWSPGVLKVIRHPDSSGEPAPAFASDAEMELAEQLRHKLEERYLEASNAPSSSQVPPLSATGSTTLATTR